MAAPHRKKSELPFLLNDGASSRSTRLPLPPPPSPFFLHCGFSVCVSVLVCVCLSLAPRIRQSPPSPVPVVAPKRQLARLPTPPPPPHPPLPPLSLSLCPLVFVTLSCPPPSRTETIKRPLPPCRSFSLPLLPPLTQYSVCLLPKPRHCQPYDITQLPYMGKRWVAMTTADSTCFSISLSLSLGPPCFISRKKVWSG